MLVFSLFLISFFSSEIIWKEEFADGDKWKDRWVLAVNKTKHYKGEWAIEAPKKCQNRERSKGMKTITDDGYYQISADIGRTISTYNKTFIFSYMVKNEQDIQVGGSYVKILPEGINQTDFDGTTPYYIMFGQDQDKGHSDRVQLILKKHGNEYQHTTPLRLEKDTRTHMFTIIMFPDLSYEIRIDNKVQRSGKMYVDFPGAFDGPTLPDPDAKKPKDWVELPEIPDPKAKKPDDWEEEMTIVDHKAKKPIWWKEKLHGEWSAPRIPNPRYRGVWMPPLVKNPEYKGEWKAPRIPNPDWEKARRNAAFKKIRYVGIEIYQPKSGSIFDNFFIGDDLKEYRTFVKQNWEPTKRYEDVYDPYEKPETFSMSGKDLFKNQKKDEDDDDDDDDYDDDDDDDDDVREL
ncbi:putative calreticulin [Monocercomonoides exilis]|uniref:putative calreticulin n=1 Tax=Monocercomonoides exilis TaxID=2049356 RepID=UPI0035593867|nr:putative calreticulin [Monocercomonoides exilis]|eukprot:MONOS_2784.1-p1 / transcript=MONOS_2784.1 / gene=MONOS_2784 / organism=Monocercomonoides_exilis_PA203 / gene_product=calreticulin / transcript_product=calreticulin / location=Mono_scaffold00059:131017-132366(+) / protein_length=402 / sequence_SO=supercontig / SO=protein_coding / is_pseudo=false